MNRFIGLVDLQKFEIYRSKQVSAKDLDMVKLNREAYRREVNEIKDKIRKATEVDGTLPRKKSGYIKTFILSFRKAFREARGN